ncbi:hypothetical protein M8J77_023129 [Diaphorina citri]|nr:hypothetical protein M8J77_023129 [Diaphorina citri]
MYLRSIVLSYVATFHLFHVSSAITSSDDRFVKKYAMMKVYESCYGPEVLKEVRKEMKAASAKCSNVITLPSSPAYASASQSFKISPPSASSHSKPMMTSASSLHEETKTTPSNIDVAKLQQIIMNGYKHVNTQQQQQQSQQLAAQQQQQLQSQQQTPYSAALQQTSGASSSLSANNANILQQVAAAAALSQLPSATQNQLRPYFWAYQSPAVTSGLGSMFYPNSLFGAHSLNPFFSSGVGQLNPYTAALYGSFGLNPFFPGRSSRDMDLRQLEGMARMTGKVKNVTCVMQELGYVSITHKAVFRGGRGPSSIELHFSSLLYVKLR